MIANPVRYFVTGSDTEKFTYEGGENLYHFSPYDNGLSNTLEDNVIFFAQTPEHALSVLKRAWEFGIQCENKFLAHARKHQWTIDGSAKRTIAKLSSYLEALKHREIVVTSVNDNQFFKVSHASNDTVFQGR